MSIIVPVKGQHCGWDNAYIIIVDVRDSLTGEVINGLEIVLADSTEKPYTSEWNLMNYQESILYQKSDILKFGQNSKKKCFKKRESFPFGANCYMLLVYYNNYRGFNKSGKDLIIIKDTRNKYNHISLEFDAKKITSLCEAMPIWDNDESLQNAKINVRLKKK